MDSVAGDEEERDSLLKKQQELLRIRTEILEIDSQLLGGGGGSSNNDRAKVNGANELSSVEDEDAELMKMSQRFEELFNLEKIHKDNLIGLEKGFQGGTKNCR